ncbi:hypothetical protein SUGI_1066910 [Cryptomeria japonica]|nr:hypothetical protein SUGI_1066910 [Cryptomeria japonica]
MAGWTSSQHLTRPFHIASRLPYTNLPRGVDPDFFAGRFLRPKANLGHAQQGLRGNRWQAPGSKKQINNRLFEGLSLGTGNGFERNSRFLLRKGHKGPWLMNLQTSNRFQPQKEAGLSSPTLKSKAWPNVVAAGSNRIRIGKAKSSLRFQNGKDLQPKAKQHSNCMEGFKKPGYGLWWQGDKPQMTPQGKVITTSSKILGQTHDLQMKKGSNLHWNVPKQN